MGGTLAVCPSGANWRFAPLSRCESAWGGRPCRAAKALEVVARAALRRRNGQDRSLRTRGQIEIAGQARNDVPVLPAMLP